jgi:hypothetical protein
MKKLKSNGTNAIPAAVRYCLIVVFLRYEWNQLYSFAAAFLHHPYPSLYYRMALVS